MQRPGPTRGFAALMFSFMLWALPAGLRAQERPPMGEHDPEMMARHQAMMAEHEQMMARVDSLAAAMNEAGGEARVDAMTALLNELVAQHRAMHDHMREMMMHGMKGEGHGMKMQGMPPAPEPPDAPEP
jgi:hypothetical protein